MHLTLIFVALCADLRVNGVVFQFIPGGDTIRNVVTPFLSSFNTTDADGNPTYTANVVRVVDPILAMRFAQDDLVSSPEDYSRLSPYTDYNLPPENLEENDRLGDPRYSPSTGSRFGLLPPWARFPHSRDEFLVYGPDHFDHDQHLPRDMLNPYLSRDDYLSDHAYPLNEYPVIERYPLRQSFPKFNPSLQADYQSGGRNNDMQSFLSQHPPLTNIPPIYRSNTAPYLRVSQGLNSRLGDYYSRNLQDVEDQITGNPRFTSDYLPNSYLSRGNLDVNLNAKTRDPYINGPYESNGRTATQDLSIEPYYFEQEQPTLLQNQGLISKPGDSYLNEAREFASQMGSNYPSLGAYLSKYEPFSGESFNLRLDAPYSSNSQGSDDMAAAKDSFIGPYGSKYVRTSRQNHETHHSPQKIEGQMESKKPSSGTSNSISKPMSQKNSDSRSRTPILNGPHVSTGRRKKRALSFFGPYNTEYEPVVRKNQWLNSILGDWYSNGPRESEVRGPENPLLAAYRSKYEPFALAGFNSRTGGRKLIDPLESDSRVAARRPFAGSYDFEYEPLSRQNQELNSRQRDSFSNDPRELDGRIGLEDPSIITYHSKYEPSLREDSNSRLRNSLPNDPYVLIDRVAAKRPFSGSYSSEYGPLSRQNQGLNSRQRGSFSNGPREFEGRMWQEDPSLTAYRTKYEPLLRENSNSRLSGPYSNYPYESNERVAAKRPFAGLYNSEYDPFSRQNQGLYSRLHDSSSNSPQEFEGRMPYSSTYAPAARQNQGFYSRPREWYSNIPQEFDRQTGSENPLLDAYRIKYEPSLGDDSNLRTDSPYLFGSLESNSPVLGRTPFAEPRQNLGLNLRPSKSYSNDPQEVEVQPGTVDPSLGVYHSKYEPGLRENSNLRLRDLYDPYELYGRRAARGRPFIGPYSPEYEPIARKNQGFYSRPREWYSSNPREFDGRMEPVNPSLGIYLSKYEPLRGDSNSRLRNPYSYDLNGPDGRIAARHPYINQSPSEYEPISQPIMGLNSRPSNSYLSNPQDFEGRTEVEDTSLGTDRFKYEPFLRENSNSRSGDPYLYGPNAESDDPVAARSSFRDLHRFQYEPSLSQSMGAYDPDEFEGRKAAQHPFVGSQQSKYEPLLNSNAGQSSRFADPYLNDPHQFWSQFAVRDPFIDTQRSDRGPFSPENWGPNLRSNKPYFDDTGSYEGPYDSNYRSSYDPSIYDSVACSDWLKPRKYLNSIDDDDDNGIFGGNSDKSPIRKNLINDLINKLLTSPNRMDSKVKSEPLTSYAKSSKTPYGSNNVNYGIFEPNFGNYPIYSFDNTNPVQNFNHQNNPSFNSKESSSNSPNKFPSFWTSHQNPTVIVSPFKSKPNFPQTLFTPLAFSLIERDADEETPSDSSSDFNADGIRTNWPKDPKTLHLGNEDGPEQLDVPSMPQTQSDKIPALMIIPTPTGDQIGITGGIQGGPQSPNEDPKLDTINSTKNINLLPIQLPEHFLKNLINSGLLSVLLNDMPGGDETAARNSLGKPEHRNTYDQNPLTGAKTPGKFTMLNPKHHKIELYNPMLRGYHGSINPFAKHHKGYGYKSF